MLSQITRGLLIVLGIFSLTVFFFFSYRYTDAAPLSACAEFKASSREGNSTSDIPGKATIEPVNTTELPAIFQFVSESDFVAIASTKRSIPIGKRVKKTELDLGDWVAGSVVEFQAEEVLFSKKLFESGIPLTMNSTKQFEILKRLDFKESYKENTRYLLFLKAIPIDDHMFVELALDKTKLYFRPYTGTQSIFPDRADPMHGSFNLGIIDLNTGKYPELVDAIRQFCKALSPGEKTERIQNLRKLTESDNKVLRENAEYAVKYFSSQANTASP